SARSTNWRTEPSSSTMSTLMGREVPFIGARALSARRSRLRSARLSRGAPAARGESPASHRGWRCARLGPAAWLPRWGPLARRDDREPGPPPRVFCAVGWQYREYLREEQRSQALGPQPGSRVGVEKGCSAGRMQWDFDHGLLIPATLAHASCTPSAVARIAP